MLARVNEDLRVASSEDAAHGGGLDELRPSSDDADDFHDLPNGPVLLKVLSMKLALENGRIRRGSQTVDPSVRVRRIRSDQIRSFPSLTSSKPSVRIVVPRMAPPIAEVPRFCPPRALLAPREIPRVPGT